MTEEKLGSGKRGGPRLPEIKKEGDPFNELNGFLSTKEKIADLEKRILGMDVFKVNKFLETYGTKEGIYRMLLGLIGNKSLCLSPVALLHLLKRATDEKLHEIFNNMSFEESLTLMEKIAQVKNGKKEYEILRERAGLQTNDKGKKVVQSKDKKEAEGAKVIPPRQTDEIDLGIEEGDLENLKIGEKTEEVVSPKISELEQTVDSVIPLEPEQEINPAEEEERLINLVENSKDLIKEKGYLVSSRLSTELGDPSFLEEQEEAVADYKKLREIIENIERETEYNKKLEEKGNKVGATHFEAHEVDDRWKIIEDANKYVRKLMKDVRYIFYPDPSAEKEKAAKLKKEFEALMSERLERFKQDNPGKIEQIKKLEQRPQMLAEDSLKRTYVKIANEFTKYLLDKYGYEGEGEAEETN